MNQKISPKPAALCTTPPGKAPRFGVTLLLLTLLCLLAYGNSFNAAWQFDDFPNIVHNEALHLERLTPGALIDAMHARPGTPAGQRSNLYRPVVCLSFAANWYWGRDSVTGYHVINFLVHLVTAFVLYGTVLALYQTPRMALPSGQALHSVALLSAALWALHPIQTQAVTYIVQRMASLAAMFFVMALWCYLKARLSSGRWHHIGGFAGCAVCFLLALGAKENAISLPLVLVFIELIFFRQEPLFKSRRQVLLSAMGLVVLAAVSILILMAGDIFSFLDGYRHRPFTLSERLLSQPRVLVLYLSQLLVPSPQRLSLLHDFAKSTSLLHPWTTSVAIILVLGLIAGALHQHRRHPLVAFAILFYFANHLAESTILPLEMVFEHRNYLPSLFLFLPFAAFLCRIIATYHRIGGVVVALVCFLLIGVGLGTHVRNAAWATSQSLWADVLHKAPGIARPYQQLADWHKSHKRYDVALKLYQAALDRPDPRPLYSRTLTLNNMANIYSALGDNEKAVQYCRRALDLNPQHRYSRYNLILALVQLGRLEAASLEADGLTADVPSHPIYLNMKGFILLKLGSPREALAYFTRALRQNPQNSKTLTHLGLAFNHMGDFQRGEWYLRLSLQRAPRELTVICYLIENRVQANDPTAVAGYVKRLFSVANMHQVRGLIQGNSETDKFLLLSEKRLAPVIAAEINRRAQALSEMAGGGV